MLLPAGPLRTLSGLPSLTHRSQQEFSKPEMDYGLTNVLWYYFQLASGEIKIIAYFD